MLNDAVTGSVESRCLALLDVVYDVAEDLQNWPRLLEELRSETSSLATMLRSSDQRTGEGRALLAAGLTPLQLAAYNEHFHPAAKALFGLHNPLFTTPGAVATPQMAVGDKDYGDSELGRLMRAAGGFYLLNAVIDVSGDLVMNVVLIRSIAQGPFDAEHSRLMELLAPHLGRTVRLVRMANDVHQLQAAQARALDYLPLAVFVCAGDGRVLKKNQAADRLLAETAELRLDEEVLHASDGSMDVRLQSALQRAATRTAPMEDAFCSRPGTSHLTSTIRVLPVPAQETRGASLEGCAVVFVTNPLWPAEPSEGVLRTIYGLSRAEAELTCMLVRGASLRDAANRLGVPENTAKSQLARVFDKTGTHKQSELIARCLGGVEALRALSHSST